MSTVERKGCPRCLYCRGSSITGSGIVNSLINKLPIELHLPGGYQYCGPGTKLRKRLARGDPGINPLDVACKHHDIAYSQNTDLTARHKADYELEQRAWERVKSNDANVGEKVAALLVTNIMKGKQRFGLGRRIQQRMTKKIAFGSGIVQKVRNKLKTGGCKTIALKSPRKAVEIAVHAARQTLKNAGGKRRIRTPRIIPIPKTGGILPLLPIFAGLSALGTLAGSAAGVSKVINDVKIGKQRLAEAERHNRSMESIALGKNGKGLYLKPYKTGLGLYLNARNPKNY
ncbi:hypothetical protein NQ318_007522 [Aromia moschata]|uniref:Phospholipase A2-like domain-containing protein n=1 Tax=Aromia moschata TaxID=1265417 RepID=A0AAV8YEX1_9CUCU|nr:hypothetical protein NQ318_007522 [Aromia moschata]